MIAKVIGKLRRIIASVLVITMIIGSGKMTVLSTPTFLFANNLDNENDKLLSNQSYFASVDFKGTKDLLLATYSENYVDIDDTIYEDELEETLDDSINDKVDLDSNYTSKIEGAKVSLEEKSKTNMEVLEGSNNLGMFGSGEGYSEADDVLINEIKSNYYTGEKFNPIGLGFYVNEEEKYYQLEKNKFTFEPSLDTTLSSANDHIDITYTGVSPNIKIKYNITVSNRRVSNLSKVSSPSLVYEVGNTIDLSGLKIRYTLDNGTSNEVEYDEESNLWDFKVEPDYGTELNTSNKKLKITYGAKELEYDIEVYNELIEVSKEESEYEILAQGIKKRYYTGETINPLGVAINNGSEIVAYQADKNSFTFKPSLNELLSSANDHIDIIYKEGTNSEKRIRYGIEVSPNIVEELTKVQGHDPKLNYAVGDTIGEDALEGLVVRVKVNDGTAAKNIAYDATSNMWDFKIEPDYGTEITATSRKLKVIYGGKSLEYDLVISGGNDGYSEADDVLINEIKSNYYTGETFNPVGLGFYVNEEEKYYQFEKNRFTFEPSLDIALSSTNDHIDITYTGVSPSIKIRYDITVSNRRVSSLSKVSSPSLVYEVGNTIDLSGLKIRYTLDNGTSNEVEYDEGSNLWDFKVEPDYETELTTVNKKLKVTYGAKEIEYDIEVYNEVIGVSEEESEYEILAQGIKKRYYTGETINPLGVGIRVGNTVVAYQADKNSFTFKPSLNELLSSANDHIDIIYKEGTNSEKRIRYGIEVSPNIVEELTKVHDPKLNYAVGDVIGEDALEGLVVRVKVNDGTAAKNIAYDATSNMWDFKIEPDYGTEITAASRKLKVIYGGKSLEYDLVIAGSGSSDGYSEADDVLIDEIKNNYYTGEKFNPLGLGFYVNEEEKYYQLEKNRFTFEPSLDTALSSANDHIDITYTGVSPSIKIRYDITVSNRQVINLSKINPPVLVYEVGNTIDLSGLKIRYTLDNGASNEVEYDEGSNLWDFRVEPDYLTGLTTANKKLKVTYGAKELEYDIEVYNEVIGISEEESEYEILAQGIKKRYYTGETINPLGVAINNGSEIVAYQADKSSFTFKPSLNELLSSANDHIDIIYKEGTNSEKRIRYGIEVSPNIVEELTRVQGHNPKLNYAVGDIIGEDALEGLVVRVKVNDGTAAKNIAYDATSNMWDFKIEPDYGTEITATSRKLKVIYGGKSLEYDLVVSGSSEGYSEADDVLINEIKSNYYTGETFNPVGLGFYVNEEEKYYQFEKNRFTFEPSLDTVLSSTNDHIDITYTGVSPSIKIRYDITVSNRRVSNLSKINPPVLVYEVGNTIDLSGLKIRYTLDNGASSEVEYDEGSNLWDFKVEPDYFDELTTANKKLKVTYGAKELEYDIEVYNELIEVTEEESEYEILAQGIKKRYYTGETINPLGVGIRVGNTIVAYQADKRSFTFKPGLNELLSSANDHIDIIYKEGTSSEKRIRYGIEVSSNIVEELTKVHDPRLNYDIGDVIGEDALEGLVVRVKVNDGTAARNITYDATSNMWDFKIEPDYGTEITAVNRKLKVIYGGKSLEYDLVVSGVIKQLIKFDFNMNGHGVQLDSIDVKEGEKLIKPVDPIEVGWTFRYWYEGTNDTVAFNFDQNIDLSHGLTRVLHAKWEAKTYRVEYDAKGGSVNPSSFTKTYDTPYEGRLATPSRAGYKFKGWYVDDTTYNTLYNKTSDDIYVEGTSTYKIYAKWTKVHKVTFDLKKYNSLGVGTNINATPVIDMQEIEDGLKATRPSTNPTAADHRFEGWYHYNTTTHTYGSAFDFSTETITADTVIYAKWYEIRTITFNFNMNGHGTQVPSQYVVEGSKVTKPTDPTATGWTFRYWYETDPNIPFDFTETIPGTSASPRTLNAKWKGIEYSITLYSLGGSKNGLTPTAPSEVLSYTTGEGKDLPMDYERGGLGVVLWYERYDEATDTYSGNRYTKIDTSTYGNKTLYARYGKEYIITYDANGGTGSMSEQKVYDFEEATLETNAFTRSGYRFDGWDGDDDKEYTDGQNIGKPTKNLTLRARWIYSVPERIDRDSSTGNTNGGSTGGYNQGVATSMQQKFNVQVTKHMNLPTNSSDFGTFKRMNMEPIKDFVIQNLGNTLSVRFNNSQDQVALNKTEDSSKIEGIYKIIVDNEEKYYYLRNDGEIYCGLMKDENNNIHYFKDNGQMELDKPLVINDRTFVINKQGEIVQDNLSKDDLIFILDQCVERLYSAEEHYDPVNNIWYALTVNPLTGEREKVTGLAKIVQENGINTYYFNEQGILLTGYIPVFGTIKYFDPLSGRLID